MLLRLAANRILGEAASRRNLSPRLAPRLLSLFAGITHVRDVGLQRSDDNSIWEWAKAHNYVIITADADFAVMSQRLGWPPKVIHIEQCDFPFRVIEDLLRRSAVRISEFDKGNVGLLAVRLPGNPTRSHQLE
jgi:predicted nuclease of predicted toxin-antitoxin system